MPLGRAVAVKVLRAQHMRDEEHKARFWHEAKALSQLKSSHTVQLFDFGVVPDGPLANVAYMVMELVEGQSLADVLDQHGPLPPTYIADVVAQCSLALTEAHRLGIIHRDLKPGNLMIMESPEGGRLVKVIDYGLAMSVDQSLSKPDTVMGTFKYVAPEQVFQKEGITADHRVDIYSMACVCWKLLTGRAPIENDNWQALLMRKMAGPPEPLPGSDADARLRAIDKVLRKALMPDPGDRHPSMNDFAEAFFAASLTEGGLPRTDPAGAMPPPPLSEKIPTPPTTVMRTPHPEPPTGPAPMVTPTFQTRPVRQPTPQAIRDAEERRTSSVSLPIVLPPSPRTGSPTPIVLATLLVLLALFVVLLWGAAGLDIRSTTAATVIRTPSEATTDLNDDDDGDRPDAAATAEDGDEADDGTPLTFGTGFDAPVAKPTPPKVVPAKVAPAAKPKPAAKRRVPPARRVAPRPTPPARPAPRPALPPRAAPSAPTTPAPAAPRAAPAPLVRAGVPATIVPPAPEEAPVDLSRPTADVISARAKAAAVARALRRCACEDARTRANDLARSPEGQVLMRSLRGRVADCEVPDVDQRCVDGRVVD